MTSSCRTLLANFANASGLRVSAGGVVEVELSFGGVCTDFSLDFGCCPTHSAADNNHAAMYQCITRPVRCILTPTDCDSIAFAQGDQMADRLESRFDSTTDCCPNKNSATHLGVTLRLQDPDCYGSAGCNASANR